MRTTGRCEIREPIHAADSPGRPVQMRGNMSLIRSLVFTSALALLMPGVSWGQRVQGTPNLTPTPSSPQPPQPNPSELYGGYIISPGDILNVHVADEDDITGVYQVNQDGKITLPLLSDPINAAGVTTFYLSNQISDQLLKQQILLHPAVTVFIAREMGQSVSVLGAVGRPGLITLEKPTTLLELISLAGGLNANAGPTLTISSKATTAAATASAVSADTSAVGSAQPRSYSIQSNVASVNISDLMSGKNPGANVLIRAGDVVSVSLAPIVYVVGAVTMPGAFTVQDSHASMTVMKAIAMAQGPQPTAALSRAVIVRQASDDASRQEITVDLKKIMTAKSTDEVLEANDILYVPQSAMKATLHQMATIATQAAATTAGYGLGLRLSH